MKDWRSITSDPSMTGTGMASRLVRPGLPRRWTVTAAALALLTLPAWGQEATTYDLQTILRTALSNHPSLRASSAQVEASRAQVRQAQAARLPRVGATLAYTQLEKDPYFIISSMGKVVFGEQENGQASLTAQLPLYTGGRVGGMVRQARAGVASSEESQARQRQRVVLNAREAYYGVLRARGLVKVAEDQLAALEAQRVAISRMVEQGVSTRIDLLRAETAVSAAQEGLTRARNGEAVATAALAVAMGMPADPNLKVSGGPIQEAPNTGTAATPPEDDHALPNTREAAIQEALQSRPDLRQVEASLRAAEAAVQVARSARRPNVGAFAQVDAERPTYMPKTGRWSVGVSLTMNLFDSGASRADVDRAQAQVAQVAAAREELRNGIAFEVSQAYLNVSSARERVETARKGAATADEGLRLVRAGYNNGVNTITDLLSAQAELTRAQTDVVVALSDLRQAEAQLRFALGQAE